MVADFLGRPALSPGNSNSLVGFVLRDVEPTVDHGDSTMKTLVAEIKQLQAEARPVKDALLQEIEQLKNDREYTVTMCDGKSESKPKRVKRKTNRLTRKEIKELIKKKKRRGIVWEC